MKVSKFKVLLYLKKSGLDKQGKAPIMGRITLNYYVRQNIARYVSCCTKLRLQHKTPCSAEGCGCPPKSVCLSILAVSIK